MISQKKTTKIAESLASECAGLQHRYAYIAGAHQDSRKTWFATATSLVAPFAEYCNNRTSSFHRRTMMPFCAEMNCRDVELHDSYTAELGAQPLFAAAFCGAQTPFANHDLVARDRKNQAGLEAYAYVQYDASGQHAARWMSQCAAPRPDSATVCANNIITQSSASASHPPMMHSEAYTDQSPIIIGAANASFLQPNCVKQAVQHEFTKQLAYANMLAAVQCDADVKHGTGTGFGETNKWHTPESTTEDYAWLLHKAVPVAREYRPMQTLLEDNNDLFPNAASDPAASVSPHSLPGAVFESASDCGQRQPKYRRRSETTCDASSYLQPLLNSSSQSQPQLLPQVQHSATSSLVCLSEYDANVFNKPTSFMASRGSDSSIYTRPAGAPSSPPGATNPRSTVVASAQVAIKNMNVDTCGTKRRKSRPSGLTEKKNLVCAVCGDAASCQHYGVRTCEGCKGFFKRTVQKNSQYVCLANKACPVDKRRRNKCQYCRYMKCIEVGMSREVVRTDSLKGRRGRLPSQRQNSGGSNGSPAASPTSSPDENFLMSILRAQTETTLKDEDRDYSQFVPPELMQGSSIENLMENWRRFTDGLASSCDLITEWSTKLTGFSELNAYDQRVLLSTAFLELFALRIACHAMRSGAQQQSENSSLSSRIARGIDDSQIVFGNGTVLHKSQIAPFLGEWLEQISDFSLSLQRLELDQTALACMQALALITERHGLVDGNSVAELQLKVVESLRNHCLLNGSQPAASPKPASTPAPAGQPASQVAGRSQAPLLFSRILGKLPDLRSLSEQGFRKFCQLKANGYLLPEKVETMLFAINTNNNNNNNNNNNLSFLLHA